MLIIQEFIKRHFRELNGAFDCISNNVNLGISEPSSNWEEQGRLGCKTLTFNWLTIVVIRVR